MKKKGKEKEKEKHTGLLGSPWDCWRLPQQKGGEKVEGEEKRERRMIWETEMLTDATVSRSLFSFN